MISLKNISKSYAIGHSILPILQDINLIIERHEYISIMGASGSGKSTLLHILGCLDTPDSGEYVLDGKTVSQLTPQALTAIRSKTLGFVFQSFHLISHYTALQNVMLPLVYSGIPKTQREKTASQLLHQVGLEKRKSHLPNELSGGERQRVAIARALVNDPAVILADEPTGNLDSFNGASILSVFKDIHSQGKTIVIVTHDEKVAVHTQRVIQMQDGKIL